MKILKLDYSGHTTIAGTDTDIQSEFDALVKSGYAMFLDDTKIKTLPTDRPDAEILALAPLVGG